MATSKPSEIKKHWDAVARLGCCVTHQPSPSLHHVHGGSCRLVGIHKGMGQKTSDWLVIPLAAELHYAGANAIDGGGITVREWETLFGTQVEWLEWVSVRLGVDVFEKAGLAHRVKFV